MIVCPQGKLYPATRCSPPKLSSAGCFLRRRRGAWPACVEFGRKRRLFIAKLGKASLPVLGECLGGSDADSFAPGCPIRRARRGSGHGFARSNKRGRHQTVMTEDTQKTAHKFGANSRDPAKKSHKHDPNFAQSRDIREDRGERQIKSTQKRHTIQPGPHSI